MKKFGILLGALLLSSITFAQGDFGLGIVLGDPTGVSAKYNISSEDSVDAGLGWSLTNDTRVHIHADYLRHIRSIFKIEQAAFDLHFGIGGRLTERHDRSDRHYDDTAIGVRVPVGLGYTFAKYPIECFFEIVPILDLIPSSEFDINVALGARYYF